MRASIGPKTAVGVKGLEKPNATSTATPGTKPTPASNTAKEQAQKKNEELKAKLESRQTETKTATGLTR